MCPVKELNNINGWLVVDKPYDMGSTTVVSRLKRLFHPTKIGHAGTLDPLATGVLPIAFGSATKLISYVMDGKKEYHFQVSWGQKTTTDDAAGEITAISEKRPTWQEIEEVIKDFTGTILQLPPIYSALKVNGKRAYDLARMGQQVALEKRTVCIESLKILNHTGDKTTFSVVCGKGTYVRSLARDMGDKLGCYGFVSVLRRESCGPFSAKESFTLDFLEKREYNENTLCIQPVITALDDILMLAVSERNAKDLSLGKKIPAREFERVPTGIFPVCWDGQVIALAQVQNGLIRPVRVLVQL